MDDSMVEATQALDFSDYGDETDEQESDRPVGFLNVPCQKGFAGKLFPLHQGDNVIGRGENCDICIPLKGLSREHACIEVKGDAHFIYDKGSRNRTRRNKHFLAASVRYELKDKDELTFGDVDCHYQKGEQPDGDETGSETGSESEFQTAPVNPGLDETANITESRLLGDYDEEDDGAESDASSDILQPTQHFANASNTQSFVGRNTTQTGNTTAHVTVLETPAATKTKRFMENVTLPESDVETTDDEGEPGLVMAVADSQDGDDSAEKSALMGVATQAYVGESDVTTDEERSPIKRALMLQPTQAYNDSDISTYSEESSHNSPARKSLLMAATQAYPCDDEPSPKKKRAVEPTMAYTMAEGIEPTQAYDMDTEEEEENPADKKTVGQTVAYTMAVGIETTQAYDMEEEVEEMDVEEKKKLMMQATQAYTGDIEEAEDDMDEKAKKKLMIAATQAYTEDKAEAADDEDEDIESVHSDTSEEFVLDGDTENEEEDEEEVRRLMDAPTLACDMEEEDEETATEDKGADDATQVFDGADKEKQDKTQVVTDDATQVIDKNNSKKADIDPSDQVETQVFNDDATQVFEEKTRAKKAPSAPASNKTRLLNEDATQVFEEEKQADDEKETQVISEDATQVFDDTGKKETKITNQDDATQVFNETSEPSDNQERSSEEATQVFDKKADPVAVGGGRRDNDDSEEEEPDFDINAVSTFAAVSEADEDTEGDAEADVAPADEGTQVFEETDVKEEKAKKAVASKASSRAVKKKPNSSQEDATQVFDDDQTAPISSSGTTMALTDETVDVKAATNVKGRASRKVTKKQSQKVQEATQVFDDQTAPVSDSSDTVPIQTDATVAVTDDDVDDTIKTTTRGKARAAKKVTGKKQTQKESEEATQVFDDQTGPISDPSETVAIQEDDTLAVTDVNVEDTIKTSARGKGRVSRQSTAKKQTQKESEEATQVFDEQLGPISDSSETVPIQEDSTVAVTEDNVDDTIKTTTRGKGRAAKKVTGKKQTQKESEEATQVSDDQTAPLTDQSETVAIQEDDTLAVTDDDVDDTIKTTTRGKGRAAKKVTGRKQTQKESEEATQVFDDQTGPISDPSDTVAIQEDDTLAVTDDDVDDTIKTTTRGKGRAAKKVTGRKQTQKESEEATQVFDDQTAPLTDQSETVAIQEDDTLAVTDDDVDDTIKTTTRGKGRAAKKVTGKKQTQKESEEATQVFDAQTAPVSDPSETVPIQEDATVAVSNDDVDDTIKTTTRGKGRAAKKVTGRKPTQKENEEATQVIDDDQTPPLSDPSDTVAIEEEPPVATKQSRRKVKGKTQDNVDVKEEDEPVSVADTLAVEEVEEDIKPKNTGKRGVQKNKSIKSNADTVCGRRGRASSAPEDSKITEENESGRGTTSTTRTSRRQNDRIDVDVEEETKAGSRKSAIKSAKKEAETPAEKNVETYLESNTAGPSDMLEPATQNYSKEKDKEKQPDEAATQRYGEEEETQKYEEDDITPPISELGLVDDEDDSPATPKPPLVSIPSRSPYKSALASPVKRKDKSPSPKRVKFVSQSSNTSSEGTAATRPSRGKKQLQKNDKGKGAKTKRGRFLDAEEETEPQETVAASARPSRSRKTKAAGSVHTDKPAPQETETVASEEKQGSKRSSRAKTGKKGNDSVGDSLPDDSVENVTTVIKPESDIGTEQAGTVGMRGGKKATRGKGRGKKQENADSVVEEVTNKASVKEEVTHNAEEEPENTKANTTKADNKSKRKSRGKKEENVDSDDNKVIIDTEEETKQSTSTEVKPSKKAPRSKARGKKEDSIDSVNSDCKVQTEEEIEQTLQDKKADNKSTRSKGRNTKKTAATVVQDKTEENSEPIEDSCGSAKLNKDDSVGNKKVGRGRTKVVENTVKPTVKTEPLDTSQTSGSKRSLTRGKAAVVKESSDTADITTEPSVADLSVSSKSGKRGGRQSSKGSSQEATVKVTEEPKPRAARGKRKSPAEEEEEPESTAAPAKKQKIKEAPKTAVSSQEPGKGKTGGSETPKSNTRRVSAVGTPKTGTPRDLDSSLVNSPTLRKSTVSADKPRVMFTGLMDEQGEKIVKDLGGELVTSVYDCTQLVTDQIRRTVKFLCGLSRGVPIVTPQWLVSSRDSGFFSDPSLFLVKDDAAEKKFKCCLRSSLAKAGENQLLAGYKIHVTKSVKPEPAQMKDIIQCAGAQYLATIPKTANEGTVIISCPDDKPQCEAAIKAGIPVVSTEFILTGILRQEADVNSYMLFSSGNGNKRSVTGSATGAAGKKKKR